MAKKYREGNRGRYIQSSLPPGSIPPIIDGWLCVSGDVINNEFTFKKGNETKVKRWAELERYYHSYLIFTAHHLIKIFLA